MKIKVKNIISKIAAVGVMILMVFSAMPNVAFAADSATALEIRHCVRCGMLPIADGGIYLRKGKI